jgi:hypothetical protein
MAGDCHALELQIWPERQKRFTDELLPIAAFV